MDGFESNVIAGLSIGGRGIQGLVGWIGSMEIGGGVAGYNRSLNVVNASLSANYMNGLSGRYGYGTMFESPAIHNSDGVYMVDGMIQPRRSYLDQYRIGEQYSVPDTDNAGRVYLSDESREVMDGMFRDNALSLNYDTYGHQVYIEDNIQQSYYDEAASNGVHGGDVNVYHPNVGYYDSPTDILYGKRNVVDSGRVMRDVMETKFPNLSSNYAELHSVSAEKSAVSDVFGDLAEFLHTNGTLSAKGLIEVADDQSDVRSFFGDKYSVYEPYGVSPSKPYRYSVMDYVEVPDTVDVDPSVKAGSMISVPNAIVSKTLNYTFFQEGGAEGISTDPFSDWMSVSMMQDSDNVSPLLRKTNELFKANKIKSLINRFHGDVLDATGSDVVTAYDSTYGMSRGRNLKSGDKPVAGDPFDDPYCRVWTAAKQYSKMGDLIRPFKEGSTVRAIQTSLGSDLRPSGGANHLANYTVLDDNGFLRISPYRKRGEAVSENDVKRYMFSIENLAWKGESQSGLTKEQLGPNGGRIMWFPPYGLTFNESTSVEWKKSSFIGRGEPVYTYANTERVGNLEFILLIDHPSSIDKWRGQFDWDGSGTDVMEEQILRYFAGCEQLDLKGNETENPADREPKPEPVNEPAYKPDNQFFEISYILFYPNNFSGVDYPVTKNNELAGKLKEYEFTDDGSEFTESDLKYKYQDLHDINKVNKSLFALNTEQGLADNRDAIKSAIFGESWEGTMHAYGVLTEPGDSDNLETMLASGEDVFRFGGPWELHDITVQGFASSHGYVSFNNDLCRNRANTLSRMVKKYCPSVSNNQINIIDGRVIDVKIPGKEDDVNELHAKIARCAVATARFKLREDFEPINISLDANNQIDVGVDLSETEDVVPASGESVDRREITISDSGATPINGNSSTGYLYSNEYLYFSRLESSDQMVYRKLTDKVRFFDPAFHTMTPEGFNARLNFLQQCTRQGPTIGSHAGNQTDVTSDGSSTYIKQAANLSFGRPPYCVLRIGDFFHTKICINSMQVNYDVGAGGVSWDMNPEGAGVQPMFAKVSITFSFIGGQDIGGPVSELQNAVTENYYANSSIYRNVREDKPGKEFFGAVRINNTYDDNYVQRI